MQKKDGRDHCATGGSLSDDERSHKKKSDSSKHGGQGHSHDQGHGSHGHAHDHDRSADDAAAVPQRLHPRKATGSNSRAITAARKSSREGGSRFFLTNEPGRLPVRNNGESADWFSKR
jgi:hypothetical protein